VSGIDNFLIKGAGKKANLVRALKDFYEDLVNNPEENIPKALDFYSFRLVAIPKPGSSPRPISIQEAPLNYLHTLLLQKMPTNKLSEAQFAFKKDNQRTICRKAYSWAKSGPILSLDIRNAFNEVPFLAIQAGLVKLGCSDTLINYAMHALEARSSYDTGQLSRGVAQGDPLSMFFFAAAINPALEELMVLYP